MLSLMSSSDSGSSSSISAQQIFDVLISDPRKTMAGGFTAIHSSPSGGEPLRLPLTYRNLIEMALQ